MKKKFDTWEEFENELDITPEQEKEIELETEIIKATIEARRKKHITQTELSRRTGIKQSAIARMEKGLHSPKVSTLIKILFSIGYEIKIVPIKKNKNG